MFGLFKKGADAARPQQQDIEQQAESLNAEIQQLEQRLGSAPRDAETQKQLMLAYNRALPLYAKSARFRPDIDALFVKIDALRNTIRTSIQEAG
ncbi:hypothetical protein [Pantoea eucrina]|uniref:Uncharacterized protein n=1 Tax=Pantoea eucrina TaxID=472693 RepID=A0ABU5LEZ9_9GAMM|nr:hypothetical protein [Pantoea eucrina]MDZ7278453.1 hypothetical protein [Pantoea eucrina]